MKRDSRITIEPPSCRLWVRGWIMALVFSSIISVHASKSMATANNNDDSLPIDNHQGVQITGSIIRGQLGDDEIHNYLLLLQCFVPEDLTPSTSVAAACCQAMDNAASWYSTHFVATGQWNFCQEDDKTLIDTKFGNELPFYSIPNYQGIVSFYSGTDPITQSSSSSSSSSSSPLTHFVWTSNTQSAKILPAANDSKNDHLSLSSTLSESGGMHRDFRHSLKIPHSPDEQQEDEQLEILIQVHIPRDLFINIEDAFVVNTIPQGFELTLLSNKDVVIDQEEPTFVSPHHIVYYSIRGPPSPTTSTTLLLIEWTTLLHVRYPMPQKDNFYTIVRMMEPFVIGSHGLSTGATPESAISQLPYGPLVEFKVANGIYSDLIPVVLVCLVASIGGTWALLREVHRYCTDE